MKWGCYGWDKKWKSFFLHCKYSQNLANFEARKNYKKYELKLRLQGLMSN